MAERIAYFDCFSGAGGDMILGALVDAGLSIEQLQEDLSRLPCEPIRLRAEKTQRGGLRCTSLEVLTAEGHHAHEHDHHAHAAHRTLADIVKIIRDADLHEKIAGTAVRIFERLAEAEAAVHGRDTEHVHFHEVGALDAIADIVGAATGLHRLGIGRVFFSTLRLGGGSVKSAHGILPVPAPATAKLIAGLRCEMGPVEAELLTPTAAAILATIGSQETPPPFRQIASGLGAGGREFPNHANCLRLLVGEIAADAESDTAWVVEANMDDATGQIMGHALEQLLAAGALDAWVTPIQMKKCRPAWKLAAIATDEKLRQIEEVFFRETTTLGVRRTRCERSKLCREFRTVQTPHGPVTMKLAVRDGKVLRAEPEYDDCLRIAREKGIPLRDVMQAARNAPLPTMP